jgi:hypothetical protein
MFREGRCYHLFRDLLALAVQHQFDIMPESPEGFHAAGSILQCMSAR